LKETLKRAVDISKESASGDGDFGIAEVLLHIADHLADFIRLGGRPAAFHFPAEQAVAQAPEELVQIVDGLAGGQGKDIVKLMHGAAARQGGRMGVNQGIDHVAVNHPEGEGRHIGVLQEMQQIADPAVQHLPAAEGQRLADGGRDPARLGQNLRQVGGDIAVPEHLLAAHHEAVFIGGGRLQIGGRSLRKIAVGKGNCGHAEAAAGFSFPADGLGYAENRCGLVGENEIQGRLQRDQLHPGSGVTVKTAEKGRAQVHGVILAPAAAGKNHRVDRPVDFQSHGPARGGGFLF